MWYLAWWILRPVQLAWRKHHWVGETHLNACVLRGIRNDTRRGRRVWGSAIPCHLSYSVYWFGSAFWMSPLTSLDENPAWEDMCGFRKPRWWVIISKSTTLNRQTQIIELPSNWSFTVKGFGRSWSGLKAACKSVPSTLLIASRIFQRWVAATHVTAFNHMHGLLLHIPSPTPFTKKINTGTPMTNWWQILPKTAHIYPMPPGLESSKPTTWGTNWKLFRPTPYLNQDRRNKVQNVQVRVWCPPVQNLSHTIYTDFPVPTCLQSRWHLWDTVRCAQTARMVHSKWASHLEVLKSQFYLCFPRAVSVERSQPPHPTPQTQHAFAFQNLRACAVCREKNGDWGVVHHSWMEWWGW